MICTETEAKTKWCPQARFKFASTSNCPSSNREGGHDANDNPWLLKGTRCIGSACMMWEWVDGDAETWVDPEDVSAHEAKGWRCDPDYKDSEIYVRMLKAPDEPRRGTCGLIQRGGE